MLPTFDVLIPQGEATQDAEKDAGASNARQPARQARDWNRHPPARASVSSCVTGRGRSEKGGGFAGAASTGPGSPAGQLPTPPGCLLKVTPGVAGTNGSQTPARETHLLDFSLESIT